VEKHTETARRRSRRSRETVPASAQIARKTLISHFVMTATMAETQAMRTNWKEQRGDRGPGH
jgi:hypothetical protein